MQEGSDTIAGQYVFLSKICNAVFDQAIADGRSVQIDTWVRTAQRVIYGVMHGQ